jgi:AbrB family looped-hinge helix DNA binding protein
MPTVKLHPEGWLSLPADVRRKLRVESGQTLEVQVVGNSVILRPAKGTTTEAEPTAAEVPASQTDPEPVPPAAEAETRAPAKRRGRPPKPKT